MSEEPVAFLGRNFPGAAADNPCEGCSAPCCQVVLTTHKTPASFMDLDYLRYLCGFPDIELIVDEAGEWRVASWKRCGFLTDDALCGVHGTARKPKTCVFFNPHGCWYRRNFHEKGEAPDIARLNAAAFEAMLAQVVIDDAGNIESVPSWQELRRLARELGPTRTLPADV
jgi:Fe-S-cluster containining protein